MFSHFLHPYGFMGLNPFTVILWSFERKQRHLHVVNPLSFVEPLFPFGLVLSVLLVLVSLSFVYYPVL